MKNQAPNPTVLKYFLVLFLISVLLLGKLLLPFFSVLIFSYLLASIFQPVYRFINRKLSPIISSLLCCCLAILVVLLPIAFFIVALSREGYAFYLYARDVEFSLTVNTFMENPTIILLKQLLAQVGITLEPEDLSGHISALTKAVGLYFYNQVTYWAANIMGFAIKLLMLVVATFFLLMDHGKLHDFLFSLSPLPDDQLRQLINKFEKTAGAVLIGNGVCALIQGTMGGLAFAYFQIGPPILWGMVVAILAFLPVVGSGLVMIPACVVLAIKGDIGSALFLFIFYMLMVFVVDYIINPKLVGSRVQMHTLLVFLSVMGGISLFGVLGIIFGPLIATTFLTLAEIYMANYSEYVKKGLPEQKPAN
ncbi:MAG: hypothetical protein A2511_00175 [Deltaproteobacteria bacterium RIFOXYD12_FULL_50_9]|nr:MAG: hypothetical protein A2511_00175 [Deltaproteobacteria bacterium RIFOXYD12_FULL_50_9]